MVTNKGIIIAAIILGFCILLASAMHAVAICKSTRQITKNCSMMQGGGRDGEQDCEQMRGRRGRDGEQDCEQMRGRRGRGGEQDCEQMGGRRGRGGEERGDREEMRGQRGRGGEERGGWSMRGQRSGQRGGRGGEEHGEERGEHGGGGGEQGPVPQLQEKQCDGNGYLFN